MELSLRLFLRTSIQNVYANAMIMQQSMQRLVERIALDFNSS